VAEDLIAVLPNGDGYAILLEESIDPAGAIGDLMEVAARPNAWLHSVDGFEIRSSAIVAFVVGHLEAGRRPVAGPER
jgi:hypothetical protein